MNTPFNLLSVTYTQKTSYHCVCYFACGKDKSVFLETLKGKRKGNGKTIPQQA
jgi:hypothetical protein